MSMDLYLLTRSVRDCDNKFMDLLMFKVAVVLNAFFYLDNFVEKSWIFPGGWFCNAQIRIFIMYNGRRKIKENNSE